MAVQIQPIEQSTTGVETSRKEKDSTESDLHYKIEDVPPWYACITLGFQSFLAMIGAAIAGPIVMASVLCIVDDHAATGELVSTSLFVSGIVTFLQSTFGSRLPIVQGGSAAFFSPIFAVLALPKYSCQIGSDGTVENTTQVNGTGSSASTMTWEGRMLVLQGCLTMASLVEMFIGLIGCVGVLMRFIGPITIAPTIVLIGMSMSGVVADLCATQWWIAIMTISLLGIFSQLLSRLRMPCTKLRGSANSNNSPIFRLYAVILTILTAWMICGILTVSGALPSTPGSWGHEARTDAHIVKLNEAPWFRIPYPGQFGWMTFNVAGVIGMITASLASVLESIGNYHACAGICCAPPPPLHAINRGIFVEGVGCLISGLCGTGVGSTSYSQHIGEIGLTKVGSRRVVQVGAGMMAFAAIFGKLGALLGTIPSPVIGGVLLAMMGMICMIGISNLHTVDLNSSRNLFILGVSLFAGIVIPPWVSAHTDSIDLGNTTVNQAFVILLRTSMTVGGVIAFVLDNIISGTLEERGMCRHWRHPAVEEKKQDGTSSILKDSGATIATYDMPFGMAVIRRIKWLQYLPISPTYRRNTGENASNTATEQRSNVGYDLGETSVP